MKKVLLIHNNNIPLELRSLNGSLNDTIDVHPIILNDDKVEMPFDTFLCEKSSSFEGLNSVLKNTQFDLIVLPFNLGEDNFTSFTGLRIAAHIRLTKEWKHFAVPILFIGVEDESEVIRYAELGNLVNTYRVFVSKLRSKEELAAKIIEIVEQCSRIGIEYNQKSFTQPYEKMLDMLNVKAPSNYATHHSLANKWAVARWIEMLSWEPNRTPSFEEKDFMSMLYFKYLMAKAGSREHFKLNNKNPLPCFPELKGKRIVLIDDEVGLWHELLKVIFDKSKAEFYYYPFGDSSSKTKDELVADIKGYLQDDFDKNGGADCYLLDLRLHDDDFVELKEGQELSGHQIAKFIKSELNQGCQIVIFTASNKSWNLKKSLVDLNACGYAIKESPEMNYSRDESYMLFCDFCGAIKDACRQTYLKNMFSKLNSFKNIGVDVSNLFENAFLLDSDRGKGENAIKKVCALNQMVFLESFLKSRFKLMDNGQVLRNGKALMEGNSVVDWTKRIYFHTILTEGKFKMVDNIEAEPIPREIGWAHYEPTANLSEIIVPLHAYYGIPLKTLKEQTLKIKNDRNSFAHGRCDTVISIDDLKKHFKDVILKVLEKEASDY